jgi:hypothetical protein
MMNEFTHQKLAHSDDPVMNQIYAVHSVEGDEPYTPQRLVALSEEWEKIARSKEWSAETLTPCTEQEAWARSAFAKVASEFMRYHDSGATRSIGPFQLDDPYRGQLWLYSHPVFRKFARSLWDYYRQGSPDHRMQPLACPRLSLEALDFVSNATKDVLYRG